MGVPTKTVPPPKTDEKPGKLTWKGNTGTKTEPKVEKMSDDDEPPKITFVSKKDRLKRDGRQAIKTEKVDKGLARLADFDHYYFQGVFSNTVVSKYSKGIFPYLTANDKSGKLGNFEGSLLWTKI